MEQFFATAALWLSLAVLSSVIAYHLRISIALIEICVGVAAAAVATHLGMFDALGANEEWLRFLASSGAVLLTFLAGAELEPEVIRRKWKEVSVVGLVGFAAPFLGCAALAYYVLGWDPRASWLGGIALGSGCFMNGRRCRVRSTPRLARSIVSFTNAASFKTAGREAAWQKILAAAWHSVGWSDAYGHALVATGRLELMLDPIMNPYDCGPFPVILREAGGYFGDWSGNETIHANEALSTTRDLLPEVLRLIRGD